MERALKHTGGIKMKLISWNVNGLRACLEKGFMDFFRAADADVFCLQEIKLSEGQLDLETQAIISIGIMRRKRVIPARPCSAGRSPSA